jgi:hypothetical protein
MTFILFLASVAVIEYILNRDSHRQPQTTDCEKLTSKSQPASADSGLLNLAQAVDVHGRGETVGTSEVTAPVHKPEADRV